MPPSPALGLDFAGLQIEGRSLVFYLRCFVPGAGTWGWEDYLAVFFG